MGVFTANEKEGRMGRFHSGTISGYIEHTHAVHDQGKNVKGNAHHMLNEVPCVLIFQVTNIEAADQVEFIHHYKEEIQHIKLSVKEELYEVLEIVKVDAVHHPGAVVVHFQDTHVAGSAVMGSIRLNYPAGLAISHQSIGTAGGNG